MAQSKVQSKSPPTGHPAGGAQLHPEKLTNSFNVVSGAHRIRVEELGVHGFRFLNVGIEGMPLGCLLLHPLLSPHMGWPLIDCGGAGKLLQAL